MRFVGTWGEFMDFLGLGGSIVRTHLEHLARVSVFTPNVHAQWMAEENLRAEIEWAQKKEERELLEVEEESERQSLLERMRQIMSALTP